MDDLARAYYWRDQGYHPWRICDTTENEERELVSFPFPEGSVIYVMARVFDQPTTMRRLLVETLHPLPQALSVRELHCRKNHLEKTLNAEKEYVRIVNELVYRRKQISHLLLEYSEKGNNVYRLGVHWMKGEKAEKELIVEAMRELRKLSNKEVPEPRFLTDEMMNEITRLQGVLGEHLS